MSGRASLCEGAAWVHVSGLREAVNMALGEAMKYPRRNLTIDITWPAEADGCWCYALGRGLDVRPHRHDPGLGKCPPTIAHDDYVALAVGE